MKKQLLFLSLILFSFTFGQITKNVFFVGNSYTYTNNLPELIKMIAASTGDTFNHQSYTPGGSTLKQHSTNPTVLSTIDQGNWDYVVLQEQSQIPSFPNTYIQSEMLPYAAQLATRVKNSNACGNPIFFMTWGYKNGDTGNCQGSSPNCTYQGMDDLIYSRYMTMAQANESLTSPVGKVWRTIIQQNPSMELYSSDGSHPSYLGSMAAAYTFYTILFKKDPTLASFNGTLTPAESQILKNTVKNIVFNQLDTWYIPANDVASRFSYQNNNTNSFQFTNQTQNATTFLWSFGDGNTSTLEHPTHTYAAAGSYQVSLTTNACGLNSTKTKTINFNNLSTEENSVSLVKIYPNPTEDLITITTPKKMSILSFTDASGRLIDYHLETTSSGYTISLRHLTHGIYLLKYSIEQKEFTKKIIKK